MVLVLTLGCNCRDSWAWASPRHWPCHGWLVGVRFGLLGGCRLGFLDFDRLGSRRRFYRSLLRGKGRGSGARLSFSWYS